MMVKELKKKVNVKNKKIMARTSKSRGASTFKLRSQGSTFKMMGSSPIREEVITMGEEKVVGTTVTDTDEDKTTVTDYRTEGTGYTPPVITPEGDKKYAELSEEEKKAQDQKYIKANTRQIIQERSETKVEPKELTPQQKMAQGVRSSKYYDPKTQTYRVKLYKYKNIGTEEQPKYTSSGRGDFISDISVDEWREKYGSIEEQRKTSPNIQL